MPLKILAVVKGCLFNHRFTNPTKIGMVVTTVATCGTDA